MIYFFTIIATFLSIETFACNTKNCIVYIPANKGTPSSIAIELTILNNAVREENRLQDYKLPKDLEIESFENIFFDTQIDLPFIGETQFFSSLNDIFDFARATLNDFTSRTGLSSEKLIANIIYGNNKELAQKVAPSDKDIDKIQNIDNDIQNVLIENLDDLKLAEKIKIYIDQNKRVISFPYSIGSTLENNSYVSLQTLVDPETLKNKYGTVHLAPILSTGNILNVNNSYILKREDFISNVGSPFLESNYTTTENTQLDFRDRHDFTIGYFNGDVSFFSITEGEPKNILTSEMNDVFAFEISSIFRKLEREAPIELISDFDVIFQGSLANKIGDTVAIDDKLGLMYILSLVEFDNGSNENFIEVINLRETDTDGFAKIIEGIPLKNNYSYNGLKIMEDGNLAFLGYSFGLDKQFFYTYDIAEQKIIDEIEMLDTNFQVGTTTSKGYAIDRLNDLYYFISSNPIEGTSRLIGIDLTTGEEKTNLLFDDTFQVFEIELNTSGNLIGKFRDTLSNEVRLFIGIPDNENDSILTLDLLGGSIISQSAIDNNQNIYYLSNFFNDINDLNAFDSISGEFLYSIPDFPTDVKNLTTSGNDLYGIKQMDLLIEVVKFKRKESLD